MEVVDVDVLCVVIVLLVVEMGIMFDVMYVVCWYVVDLFFGDLIVVVL